MYVDLPLNYEDLVLKYSLCVKPCKKNWPNSDKHTSYWKSLKGFIKFYGMHLDGPIQFLPHQNMQQKSKNS